MAKNFIQDIVTKNRRSIRQISIDKRRRPIQDETDEIFEEKKESKVNRQERGRKESKINIQKMTIWIIAIFSVAFFSFAISSSFSTATITVVPKKADIQLDDTYIVKKDSLAGELKYEIITLSKKASKQLQATETEDVATKASGKIIIYNNFSGAPQRFVKNTRFESEKGLIYKINNSVTVPGKKTLGNKEIPGSIEVLVFADETGGKYNMKMEELKGDFKVVGLKGDKKYNYFYARLKSDLSGGARGLVKKVPSVKINEAREELKAKLKTELLREANSTKPESFVMFDDGYYVDYTSAPDSPIINDNNIEINERATFYGIIFDKSKLSSYIAEKKLSSYDGASVDMNLDGGAKIVISSNLKSKQWEGDYLNLSIKGKVSFIWFYDNTALKKSLAGHRWTESKVIASSYPGIKEINSIVIRPFWKRSFPSNSEKIEIRDSATKI